MCHGSSPIFACHGLEIDLITFIFDLRLDIIKIRFQRLKKKKQKKTKQKQTQQKSAS